MFIWFVFLGGWSSGVGLVGNSLTIIIAFILLMANLPPPMSRVFGLQRKARNIVRKIAACDYLILAAEDGSLFRNQNSSTWKDWAQTPYLTYKKWNEQRKRSVAERSLELRILCASFPISFYAMTAAKRHCPRLDSKLKALAIAMSNYRESLYDELGKLSSSASNHS
jgi:hypothetical protein